MRNLLLVLVSVLLSLLLAELALRFVGWGPPGVPPASSANNADRGFRYDPAYAYEPSPGSWIRPLLAPDRPDQADARGLRTGHPQAKPPGTLRILTLGDSVVHAVEVAREHSWPERLEAQLRAASGQSLQVINGGVSGYVSWQARARLERHGLAYAPDLVLLLVGWNDFYFGSQPNWRPRMTLVDFEQAKQAAPEQPIDRTLKAWLKTHSAIAYWVARAREQQFLRRLQAQVQDQRLSDCSTPFNEAALSEYLQELDALAAELAARELPLAIVRFPLLPGTEPRPPQEVQDKMLTHYYNAPLCYREYREGHARYLAAIDAFSARHPEVILIDAHRAFEALPYEEKSALFVDLAHLTAEGNDLLARVASESLLAASERWLDRREDDASAMPHGASKSVSAADSGRP